MFLSLVDTSSLLASEASWTLDVMTTCLNPRQLPFGGGQPRFQLDSGGPLQTITCLTPPTKTPAGPRRRVVATDFAPDAQSPVAREPRREC